MCVTDRHDMTLAVKVALNPNTTNQPRETILTVSDPTGESVSLESEIVKVVSLSTTEICEITRSALSQTSPGFYVFAEQSF